MAEINLLKSDIGAGRGLSAGGKRSLFWPYILAGIFIFEILGYGTLFVFERSLQKQRQTLDQEVTRVDFEIGKIDKERLEAVSYQKRLGNFKTLLDRHIFWTVVLEELSKYTYKPVSYTSLQADIKEYKLMVSGFVPSYTDLGKLMLGLKTSSNIEDVKFVSSGQNKSEQGGLSFDMEIIFNPKLLKK